MYNKKVDIAVNEAKNLKEKVVGLIGKEKAKALLIKTHFGIHTFGLKFPIDVLILNKKNKVAKLSKHLKPGKILMWNPLHETVLELPEGTVDKKKIKINDLISVRLLP